MKNTYRHLLFSCTAVFLLWPLSLTTSYAAEQLLDKVVAVVNDQIILKSELSQKVYQQVQNMQAQNIPVNDVDVLQQKVLDNLILQKLQIARAKQNGLNVAEDEINQQLAAIAEQNNLSMYALRNQLNVERNNGFQALRDDIRQQILIQKLRETEIISQSFVSENEIQNYLKRQQLANQKVEVNLAHILIALPESATNEERKQTLQEAQDVRNKLLQGQDFAQLAVRHSDGSKALSGGDLGWLNKSEVPTFLAKAVTSLKAGQISDVLQSPSGFHIIKVKSKRDNSISQAKTQYHLHRFVIASDNNDPTQVPNELTQLANNMDSMQDFQALFSQFNDTPKEINQNSDLGWRTLEEIPNVIASDVENMAVKSALPPLATEIGWMLLYLDDKKQTQSVDKTLKEEAARAIRARKANEKFELWLRRLRDEAFIQIKL